MKIKVTSQKNNPLLDRMEITFSIDHEKNDGTPKRVEVRKMLAALLKTDIELVYIKKIETKTGTLITVGEANAYKSIEQSRVVEPKYILARNSQEQKEE